MTVNFADRMTTAILCKNYHTLFNSYEPRATSIVFITIEIPLIDSHLPSLFLIGFNWPLIPFWFVPILWIHLNSSQLLASMIRTNTIPPQTLTMTSILKMPVVLKSPKDWKVWYEIFCSSAQARGILSLINVNAAIFRQLIKPFKLNYSEVKPDTKSYADLSADGKDHYKILMIKY